jgi:hypothetical protein
MKKRLSLLMCLCIILVLAVTPILTSCSTAPGDSEPGGEEPPEGSESADAEWPETLRMGGASVGGMLYVIVGGYANMVQNFVGINTTVEETGGPVDNIQLIQNKQNEMGAASSGTLYEAWNGEAWADGTEYRDIRAIVPTHPSYSYITFLAKNPINSWDEVPEKTIGYGPQTGTPATQFPKHFEISGISPKKAVYASFGDVQSQLKDGLIDGIIYIASYPYAPQVEMEATMEAGMLAPPPEVIDELVEQHPYFAKGVLPKDSYPSVKEDMDTSVMWTYIIGHKNLPEDLVYEMTKSSYEEVEYLKTALATWDQYMKPEVMLTSPIPLHPGAIKYYREIGLDIPDKLIPPEMK